MDIHYVPVTKKARRRLHPETASFQEIKKAFIIAMRIPSLKKSVAQMKIVLKEADAYRRRNTLSIIADKKVTQSLAQTQKSFS